MNVHYMEELRLLYIIILQNMTGVKSMVTYLTRHVFMDICLFTDIVAAV